MMKRASQRVFLMPKEDIRNLSFHALTGYVTRKGEKEFRAQQLFEWIYKKNISRFDRMPNLPAKLIAHLQKDFACDLLLLVRKQISKDGTVKMLFGLEDQEFIETVVIPSAKRITICLSSQVGCKFGCVFCASGKRGWQRHLSCAEILAQILTAQVVLKCHVTHVVFMGVGEPLDNLETILGALRMINAKQGLAIAARRITVSTCGLIPGINRLAQEKMQFELAISLHGSNDPVRNQLVPVNKKFSLKALMLACRHYAKKTNRQITFEYILIKDLTCTPQTARELKHLFKGLLCKVNLIPYNEVTGLPYKKPSQREIARFRSALRYYGIHATMRQIRGQDIQAACGQLRSFHENDRGAQQPHFN